MKALITGHCGFIGQHLWRALIEDGWQVEGYDLREGRDIRNHDYLPDADVCFHLAALTDARSKNAKAIVDTNILGTLYVLEQFKDRVVFASSSAVNYPNTPYAVSKLTGEHLCRSFNATIIRLCNIMGDGGHGVFEKFKEADILTIHGDGNQIRSYAPVADAVDALLSQPRQKFLVLQGHDLTVNDIAKQFVNKPRRYVACDPNDIMDGRQIRA